MATDFFWLYRSTIVKSSVTDGHIVVWDGDQDNLTAGPRGVRDGGAPVGSGNVTTAATLTDHAIVVGNGGVDIDVLPSLGTTTTVLHGDAAGDPTFGPVVEDDITLADVTTNNSSTAKHGLLKKLSNVSTDFMNGQGNWTTPAGSGGNVTTSVILTDHALVLGNGSTDVEVLGSLGTATTVLHGNAAGDPSFGAVVEADQTLADNTTHDVSTSMHGYAPKAPNDASKFLDGTGGYSVPPGGGSTSAVPIVVTTNTTVATNTGWVIPESLEVSDGITLEIAGGARTEITGDASPIWMPEVTRPPTTGWSWVNQGSASIVTSRRGGLFLSGPKGATINWRLYLRTAPPTPYAVTVGFVPGLINSGTNQRVGLIFRESSSGKFIGMSMQGFVPSSSVGSNSDLSKWTNATTFSATYMTRNNQPELQHGPLCFFRIADDGVNRRTFIGLGDGEFFIEIHSIGRTDFCTADQIGFGVSEETNTFDVGLHIISWKVE